MLLTVYRHPELAVRGVCHGQSQVDLAESPAAAAAAIVDELSWKARLDSFNVAWSSPWNQTRLVAQHLAEELGIEHREDTRLSEMRFGDWEGKSYSEIRAEQPEKFQMWMETWLTEGAPGGETVEDFLNRVGSWFAEFKEQSKSGLMISHSGTIRALLHHFHEAPFSELIARPIAEGDSFNFEFSDE